MKRWKVNKRDLFLILCVFAITGTTTAFVSKAITGWVGFTDSSHWALKLFLRIGVLVFGYQAILLFVAFLFGQFSFFWQFEKRILQTLRLMKKKPDFKTLSANPDSEGRKGPALKFRIAVFASGTGTNAQKIMEHFKDSALAKVALIVCNKSGAGVIPIAEKSGVPVLLIEKERFFNGDAYVHSLQEHGIDFLVLAGFLWKIPKPLINVYRKRIVNIHPALLPKFGGKGMYGRYVHEAVLNAGEVESGITVHYVDEHYDNGDIIFQTPCPVLSGDTPNDIAQRIHQLEHLHYPGVIESTLKSLTH